MKIPNNKSTIAIAALCCLVAGFTNSAVARAEAAVTAHEDEIQFQSRMASVDYHKRTGAMDILWRDGHKLINLTSGAQLENGQKLSTSQYVKHELDINAAKVTLAPATKEREYTIRSTSPGLPALIQHVWMYDDSPWVVIQAELDREASGIGTRHFDAVELRGKESIDLGAGSALRMLHVPYDNDMWFRFNSVDLSAAKATDRISSDEVTAIYDNRSRQALVLGSVTHDVWKTAIDAHASAGEFADLDIYGGITSPHDIRSDTHDTVPHGVVSGARVTSPAICLGSFSDWRDGLEAYGKMNAAIQPPLAWPGGAPMGWNSWAAYADKINDRRYLDSAAFVRDRLVPLGFGKNKIIYINFDAFWSNLDAIHLIEAADNVRKMSTDTAHFEPGIYWTPFAYWSDELDAYVEGTGMKYRYRDILLKAPDGSPLPKVDGGRAIDPSHPGTRMRTEYYMQKFQQLGFKYLKIDFLSHGALEGKHSDPAVQTGVEAYNLGMRELVKANGNRMFLSLSIAPLFPSGYGHARRLSCDTKGHISGGDQSTEYMLNALTYGWWTDKSLYITDPDHVVLGEKADLGARNEVEGRSRLLSAVISGGMILDSSRLADDPQGQQLALAVYGNQRLFAVAAEGKVFRPLEGDTGDKAANVFVRPSARGYYVAAFNFDEKQPVAVQVAIDRIAPEWKGMKSLSVTDVVAGTELPRASESLRIELQPAESKLFEIRR